MDTRHGVSRQCECSQLRPNSPADAVACHPHTSIRSLDAMEQPQPLSDAAFASVAAAIFANGSPTVVEAYSDFDKEPLRFLAAEDICEYSKRARGSGLTCVHLALHFPDTLGELRKRRITLHPVKFQGHTHRFTCEGWGLVFAYRRPEQGRVLHISAYAEAGRGSGPNHARNGPHRTLGLARSCAARSAPQNIATQGDGMIVKMPSSHSLKGTASPLRGAPHLRRLG